MEIFKLFGSILIKSSDAEASIQKTENKAVGFAKTLGNGIKTAAKWGAAIVAGAGAAGAAILGIANKSAAAADEIDKMSQKIGLTKQSYQEWNYAMGQSGVDIGVMQTGVKTLTNLMDSAKKGTESAVNAFDALGLSIYNADGALKDQETMMREAIMTLASMEDSTERAKLATQLFGKAGSELEPLLNSGADGIQELIDRSHELGLVMSDEAVNAGVKFGDTLADVKSSFAMVVTQIGSEVMPMLQGGLDWVLAHMPEIQATVSWVLYGISTGIAKLQAFWDKHGDAITEKTEKVMAICGAVIQYGMDLIGKIIDTAMYIIDGDLEHAWKNILDILSGAGTKLYEIGKQAFNFLLSGLRAKWEDIQSWVSSKVSWLTSKLKFWESGQDQMSRGGGFSHAGGVAYVPYDNYPAILHRGERVLTARDNQDYNDNKRRDDDREPGPITIVVQSVLDGKVVGETVTRYQDNKRRAYGV